jgi:hypothetical protein
MRRDTATAGAAALIYKRVYTATAREIHKNEKRKETGKEKMRNARKKRERVA